MGIIMRLIDVIRDLEVFENEGIICATEPWTEDSKAIVVVENEARQLPAEAAKFGMEYFVEVFVAREFLQDWRANLDRPPTLVEKCARLIQYAINDA